MSDFVNSIETLPVAAYTTDAEGWITSYNQAAVRLWGRTPLPDDRWCGSWRIRALDGRLLPHAKCPMAVAIKEDRAVRNFEAYAERPDGSAVRFRPYPTPVHDQFGHIVGAINILIDIDNHPLDARGLRDTPAQPENWSREMLTMQSEVTIAGSDLGAIMHAVVEGALRMFPHADSAVIEMRDGDDLVYRAASGTSADKIGLRLKLASSLSGRCVMAGETQVCDDTETDWRVDREACRRVGVRSMIVVPLPFQGEYVGVLKVCASVPSAFDSRDLLTAQLLAGPVTMGLASAAHADATLARVEADRRFVATFEQAAVGIAHVAPDGRLLLVNDRFCEIAGRSREVLLASGFETITHPDDLEADLRNVEALLAGRTERYAMEKRYVRQDGTSVWVNLTVSLVRKSNGAPDFLVGVVEDISARKAAEEASRHDGLTGLLNRRGILEKLTLELGRRRVAGRALTVAYLDLDGFKAINDQYGHGEGDRCLVKVAAAMRLSLRSEDVIARLGGDEFVAILPASASDAQATLIRLRQAVLAAGEEEPWQLAVSTGAVTVQPSGNFDAAQVIAAADSLMYRAKSMKAGGPVIATLGGSAGSTR